MNRDFKGIWIPKEIWLHPNLNSFEKLLLAEIDSLDHEDEHYYASDQYFMDFFNCSRPQIQRGLKKLSDENLIEIVLMECRKRRIKSTGGKDDFSK